MDAKEEMQARQAAQMQAGQEEQMQVYVYVEAIDSEIRAFRSSKRKQPASFIHDSKCRRLGKHRSSGRTRRR